MIGIQRVDHAQAECQADETDDINASHVGAFQV
jgi:hypothetical protein